MAAAIVLTQVKSQLRDVYYSISIMPVLFPGVIIGISTVVLWDRIAGLGGGGFISDIGRNGIFLTILAQTCFISTYCFLIFVARLQRFDQTQEEAALDLGATQTRLAVGERDWNFGGNGSHWVPQLWGTESIAWRTDKWSPNGLPSFGDIWEADPEISGAYMMGRTYSMMTGCGIWMHHQGKMDFWSSYKDEETMRKNWETITAYCISKKSNLVKFWSGADPQKQGFTSDGVIVGQTWDGPIAAMMKAGEPVAYQTTDEGALAWIDGITLSAKAENIDEAYELINYSFTPEVGGATINAIGYNSAVNGASDHYSAETKALAKAIYPGDTSTKLNPWPPEPPWYADARAEYANKFETA